MHASSRSVSNRFAWPVATLVLLAGAAISRAQPAVLEQVPDDALVVLKVKNLADTSAKIARFFQQTGVAALRAELADPLGALQKQANIQAGLDKAGDMAVVMMDPDIVAGGEADRAVMVLVPITDYQAFLGNFANPKTEGAVTQVAMGPAKEPAFAAQRGKFAALSPNKNLVARPLKPIKIVGQAARHMAQTDVIVLANMPALRPKGLAAIQGGRAQAIQAMEAQLKAEKKDNVIPTVRAALAVVFDGVEQFLQDAQAITLGINFKAEGVGATLVADFLPGSGYGKFVAQMKNTDQSLLAGLPAARYLLLAGMRIDGPAIVKLVDDAAGPVLKQLEGAVGPDGAKAIRGYVDAIKAQLGATQGQSFGMLAPAGKLGQESMLQMVSVLEGDAKQIAASQVQMLQAQTALMGAIDPKLAEQMKYTVTPNAKTVDGVQLDQIKLDMKLEGQTPQEQQAAQMVRMMYGPAGFSGYMGAVDPRHMLVVMGTGEEALAKAVAAAKASTDEMGKVDTVQAVAGQLPQQRMAVVYLPLDVAVATGLNIAGQMGMQSKVRMPQGLPPVGMSLASEGSALRVDGYLPSQLVQAMISVGMQVFMEMRGGAQPGGPGGL